MKRLLTLILIGILSASAAFAAEVTRDKKDISILPVFASRETYRHKFFDKAYFDSSISKVFSDLKRFNVIGYDFSMDKLTSVDDFIAKIQDAKKKAALNDTNYMDEELGAIVISGEQLEKLANSFFVVIPTVNSVQVKGGTYVYGFPPSSHYGYKANVTISVRFIDTAGKLLDVYNQNGEGTADSETKAYDEAVDSAMSMFTKFVRSMDEFRLKTQVKAIRSDGIVAELGRNMGVQPGYEYTVAKQSTDEFEQGKDIGMIRVREISDSNSLATVIFGSPQIGDQLIEAPMAGFRIIPFVEGYLALPMTSGGTIGVLPAIGFAVEKEVGYNFNIEARLSYLPTLMGTFDTWDGYLDDYFYLPATAEIGISWELYMGPTSLQFGLDGGLLGAYAYDLSGDSQFFWLSGLGKAKLSLNLQLAQAFKLKLTVGAAAALGLVSFVAPMAGVEGVIRF